ncbi:hypothetical protein GCM10020367_49610 [Streptomyces sannanensis]|uniref:Secreted protein n=1 Tax=Streptomyces sannanensis TaxID=285536 RepID=A0ABP6SHH7_9ACTN
MCSMASWRLESAFALTPTATAMSTSGAATVSADCGTSGQLGSEVAHSAHHALGRHLVQSRTPNGVHEPFSQAVHEVDGR